MKSSIKEVVVKNEAIIEFLSWAMKQPKGENKVILTIEEVPEPRS